MSSKSLRGLLAPRPSLTTIVPAITNIYTSTAASIRWFTSSNVRAAGPSSSAKPAKRPGVASRRNKGPTRTEYYARVKVLKKNMFSPAPPPLRMGRLRWLRHWTIHRAWQLFQRNQREALQKERMRMHAGMYNACEELRKTVGPGERTEGYLYRVAMEKKGVWGTHGVPIEYARYQTDSPAYEAWNHGWQR